MRQVHRAGWTLIGLLSAVSATAVAQDGAATAPASAPAGSEAVLSRVIEVQGDAKWAPLGSDDYQPIQLDDTFPPETVIYTGIRSSVKLQIGEEEPYTCMLIESVGKTIISEAYKTADAKHVRVGVGYGRIRAGVAESGLRSEFTVDSPVATLSKRGTWGFTLYYERGTDVFEIGLTERGLIEAINQVTAQRRTLSPGQLVTEAMRRWLDEASIQRNVAVADFLGQEDYLIAFNRIRQSGLGVINPGEGGALINLSNPGARQSFANLVENTIGPVGPGIALPPPPGSRFRPEGFFGSGRGDDLVDLLIDASNPLAQQGFAKAGRYAIRRSALVHWLRDYKR